VAASDAPIALRNELLGCRGKLTSKVRPDTGFLFDIGNDSILRLDTPTPTSYARGSRCEARRPTTVVYGNSITAGHFCRGAAINRYPSRRYPPMSCRSGASPYREPGSCGAAASWDRQTQAEIVSRLQTHIEPRTSNVRSNSTREISWIDQSHAVIILTISMKRTTPLSL